MHWRARRSIPPEDNHDTASLLFIMLGVGLMSIGAVLALFSR